MMLRLDGPRFGGALVALTLLTGTAYAQGETTPSPQQAKLDEVVTVTFANTQLHFVLEELQKRTEANITISPSVNRWETSLTISASKLTLGQALDKIQKRLKLSRTLWAGAILLHPAKKQAPPQTTAPARIKGARALRLALSLQNVRTPLPTVLKRLEKRTGVTMSIPARVRVQLRKRGVNVTLRLYRTPVHQVLDQLGLQCGLSWELANGRVTFALLKPNEVSVEVDTLDYSAKKSGLKLEGPKIDLDSIVKRLRAARSRSTAVRELILYGKKSLPKVGAVLRAEGEERAKGPTVAAALRIISELGDPSEYMAVLTIFKDKKRSVDLRIQAADTLAAVRAPQVVGDLIAALDDQTSLRLAEGARRALVAIGAPSVKPLYQAYQALLAKTERRVRGGLLGRALMIFGEINTNAAKSVLLTALQTKQGERAVTIRHHAAIGLGLTRDPQVVPVLIKALEEERDFLISKYITRSLSWITDEKFPPDARRWRAWWENTGKRRYGKGESVEAILKRFAGGKMELQLDAKGFAKLNETDKQRVQRLLSDLGGSDSTKIKAASHDLAALGKKALPALRVASKGQGKLAARAAKLVEEIEERLVE
jgi:hypothetical protein